MVKLTIDLIARSKSGYTKKKRDETVEQYLNRLTHLYLEGKNIDEIDDGLELCGKLSVLYLYDNNLKEMPQLVNNRHLTHLYLQNNQISHIGHVGSLGRLVKLYLGHNCITVLEGLEKLTSLTELHIEHQNLPSGEKLLFDTSSLNAITNSLQVLDISGNNVGSIRELECLVNLNCLIARSNDLTDLKELRTVLQKLSSLVRLDFSGNPLCGASKYRDNIILVAITLESLDGKEITKLAKDFVLNWYANRDAIRKRNATLSQPGIMIDYSQAHRDLPPMEGTPHLGGFFMPGLKNRQFDSVLARSATTLNSVQIEEPIRATSGILPSSSNRTGRYH